MAFPVAPTESGGAKLHFGTTDGNAAAGWFAVDTGVTGTGSNTVGFLGIATHVHDDPAGSPGGLATSSVPLVVAGAVRDDALSTLTPAAGDAVYLLVDSEGALWTHDAALVAALSGSELQVDVVASLPAGTNNIGDVDVLTLPATAAEAAALPGVFVVVAGDDGTDTHPLQVAADGDLKVTLDSEAVVLGAGSAAIGKLAANSGVDIGDVDVASMPGTAAEAAALPALFVVVAGDDGTDTHPLQVAADGDLKITLDGESVTVDLGSNNDVVVEGDVAHDSLDSGGGGPVKIGGRAQTSWAQPEEVADDDRVDILVDRSGYVRVRGDFDPKFADINDAVSGNNTIIAATAGKRIAVWECFVISDGTVDVRFEDGAGGTAFTGQIPLQAREGYERTAGGIVPLFVGAVNTLLNLELSAAVNVHGGVSYTLIDD